MKKTLKFVSSSEIGRNFDSPYNNFIEHRYHLFSHLLPKSLFHLPRLLSYSLPQNSNIHYKCTAEVYSFFSSFTPENKISSCNFLTG